MTEPGPGHQRRLVVAEVQPGRRPTPAPPSAVRVAERIAIGQDSGIADAHRRAATEHTRASAAIADHEAALAAGARRPSTGYGPPLDASGARRGRAPGRARRDALHRADRGRRRVLAADRGAGRRWPRCTTRPTSTGIAVARALFPDVPQVAVFDTAFHPTMPEHAYTLRGAARSGATSTGSAATASTAPRTSTSSRRDGAELLGPAARGRSTSSCCTWATGRPRRRSPAAGRVDTSMGLTPLGGPGDGHPLGRRRPGRARPPARAWLGWSLDEIDTLLNRRVRPARPVRRQRLAGGAAAGSTRATPRPSSPSTSTATGCASTSAPTTRCSAGGRDRVHRRRRRARRTGAGQALGGLERLGIGDRRRRRNERARPPAPARSRTDGREVAVLVVPDERGVADRPRGTRGRARVALGGSSLAPGTSKVDVSALRRTMTSGQR